MEHAFEDIGKEVVQALIVLTDPILFSARNRIVGLADRSQLPTMYFFREFVVEGGLVSYAPSDLFRRAATYVDRVLRGSNPAELPVQ